MKIGGRNPNGPLRIPVLDKYSDRGTVRVVTNHLLVMDASMHVLSALSDSDGQG